MAIFRLGWLCDDCYMILCELFKQELEVANITNLFKSPCTTCGEPGTRLADLPKVEEKKESEGWNPGETT